MKKCCWDDCENPRKIKKETIQNGDETSYRYCDYHYPIMKRAGRYNLNKYEVEMAMKQKCCNLCGNEFKSSREPVIDHCHNTGIVRGVLCTKCNVGLGAFNDNIEGLMEAIRYLKGTWEPKSGCFIPHEPLDLSNEPMPWE